MGKQGTKSLKSVIREHLLKFPKGRYYIGRARRRRAMKGKPAYKYGVVTTCFRNHMGYFGATDIFGKRFFNQIKKAHVLLFELDDDATSGAKERFTEQNLMKYARKIDMPTENLKESDIADEGDGDGPRYGRAQLSDFLYCIVVEGETLESIAPKAGSRRRYIPRIQAKYYSERGPRVRTKTS